MPSGATMIQQAMSKAGKESMGRVVLNTHITALSSTTFTAPFFFANGQYNTESFLGWIVWRPGSATSADWVRVVSSCTPSTGVITVDRSWADSTIGSEDIYLLPPGVLPNLIIDAAQNALKKLYFWNQEPLSMKPSGTTVADAGMQNSAMTSWTESDSDGGAAITGSKVTTANSENVFRGIGSMRGLNAAAGGYLRQRFNVTPNDQLIVHAISRLDSGTNAELVLRDVSNSAFIGTTVEHNLESWQFMRRTESVPDGCKIFELRLQGEGTTDDVYWNGVFVVTASMKQMILDTRWDTVEKIPSLAVVRWGMSSGDGTYDAFSTTLEEIPDELYKFDFERPGANPSRIIFFPGIEAYLQYPIYIQGRRAYSDLYSVTLSDITTSIPIETDLWDAAFRAEFYMQGEVQKAIYDWQWQLNRAAGDFSQANRKTQKETASKKVEHGNWTPVRN